METHTILAIATAPLVADLVRRYHAYKYPFDGSFFSGLFLFIKRIVNRGSSNDTASAGVRSESHSSSSGVFIPEEAASSLTVSDPCENATAEKRSDR